MLFQANPDSSSSSITDLPKTTTNLRYPGKSTNGLTSSVPLSSKAREIARNREEMLSLLKDVPESDWELSLTDLVERKSTKEKESIDEHKNSAKKKKDWMKKSNSSSSSSSFRSSSDGVLLNFFMPVSLTRSLTTPRARKGVVQRDAIDCNNKSEKEGLARTKGCLPAFLYRRRDKSKKSEYRI